MQASSSSSRTCVFSSESTAGTAGSRSYGSRVICICSAGLPCKIVTAQLPGRQSPRYSQHWCACKNSCMNKMQNWPARPPTHPRSRPYALLRHLLGNVFPLSVSLRGNTDVLAAPHAQAAAHQARHLQQGSIDKGLHCSCRTLMLRQPPISPATCAAAQCCISVQRPAVWGLLTRNSRV